MLPVSQPILGIDEKTALAAVIDSGWITMGDRVRAFERAFAKQHDAIDAVAVNSCTAALHLALKALGVGPGDEVLAPSLTFVATVNCVLYAGATPVFIDIEALDRPLMSLADAEAKCTAKTKAIVLMHYAGYVANGEAWRGFAKSRNLLLIEDAAHCAGAAHAGKIGHAAAFSFYGNKNMTTAEGGMVTAQDEGVRNEIRQMRGHGLTSGTFQRFSTGAVGYDVTMLGYNYRMDELRAALGLVQLTKLAEWNEKRKTLTQNYMRLLKELCPNVCVPFADWRDATAKNSAHHIMPVVLPANVDRQIIISRLQDAGIQTSNHYPAVHRLSFYRGLFPAVHLPRTDEYARRQLTLPLHPGMSNRHVECVTAALAQALANSAVNRALP